MSMVKNKKLSRFIVAVLAVMTILAYSVPASVFAVDSVTCELKAKKVLEGGTLTEGQFEFSIKPVGNAPAPEKTTAKNDAEGNVSFGNATFTQAGTYEYTVTEVKGNDSTITYDTKEKKITVTVTANDTSSGTVAPNNGDNYLPQKHDTGQTTAPIDVTYNHGGDDEEGWYSAKSVTFKAENGGATENVFCGVNYKSGSGRDFGTRSIWNADYNAWQAPTGILWGVETPSGVIDLIPAGCGKGRNRWLDYVAYLYTYDYSQRDKDGSSGAWASSSDPDVMYDWGLRDAVQKVLWNGYPYNAANFSNVSALRKTTQEALFFVLKCGGGYQSGALDNTAGGFRDFAPDKEMFDKLINYALKGEGGLSNYPEGTETYVYWPTEFTDGSTGCKTLAPQPLIGMYAPYQPPALSAEATVAEFKNTKSEETPNNDENNDKGKLSTTVSAGGKTASATAAISLTADEAAEITSIIDKIDYEGLVGGATYNVQGTLMDVTNASKPTAVATSEAKDFKADASGKGSWEVEFKNVQLEAGRKFVVFESATLVKDADGNEITGSTPITHEEVNDKAQTIIVGQSEDEEYTSNLSATKTTDTKTATVGDVIPYTITITNDGNADAKDVKVTDVIGEYLKYVSDDSKGNNVGQNVNWTVDVPAGSSIEIAIDCEVTEGATGKLINKVLIIDSTNPDDIQEYEDNATVAFAPPEDEDDGSDSSKKGDAASQSKKSLAATSDEFNLGLWAILATISGLALAAGALRRRYER